MHACKKLAELGTEKFVPRFLERMRGILTSSAGSGSILRGGHGFRRPFGRRRDVETPLSWDVGTPIDCAINGESRRSSVNYLWKTVLTFG